MAIPNAEAARQQPPLARTRRIPHWLGWMVGWLLAAGVSAAGVSAAAPGPVASAAPSDATTELEVFVREGCPHCGAAKVFLEGWQRQHPRPAIVVRPVDQDPAALAALLDASRRAGVWPPGVPTFVYGERVLVGFDDPAQFEDELRWLIADADSAAGTRAADSPPAATAAVDAGWLGTLTLAELGLPLFTLAVGLLDGFNPCAMWVLLFLLSLLVHLRDRVRMALIAGTFVLASGAVYYAFMAAWLNLFLAVGLSAIIRIGLALLALVIAAVNIKDFLAGPGGLTFSIPDRAKPGIYARLRNIVQAPSLLLALSGVIALAIVVNFVELLCTAGLPAMYTAVLAEQGLDAPARYGFLLLYIVGYVVDDAVMVALAVVALGSRKLTETGGRWLKLLSGCVMLVLALVMLLRPDWLS
jgi:glutaredoxin